MALIELRDMTKTYGARSVLAQVNLSIDEGEFVSVVGTSASGKTSLLKVACGLVEPSSGAVMFNGEPVRGFLREASIVFQNYSLLPWLSALENVRLAVKAAYPEWSKRQQQDQAEKYLQLVGLGTAMVKRPSQLSGGMRQRVAIARAFAVEPRVLFLDEPFSALDALTRSTLQQELARLCQAVTRPVTALLITNSVDEAILLSDRILALSRGPGASLSAAVQVPLGRPRAADLLMHDEQAARVRIRISEFLSAGAAGGHGVTARSSLAVSQGIPVEAES